MYRLKEPTLDDVTKIDEAVRASLPELKRWMSWATDDYDESGVVAWINGAHGEAHDFIVLDDDGRMLGTVAINQIDHVNRRGNLGYWVRSDVTGRGIATSVARDLAIRGLTELGFERLEIVVAVGNDASARIARKLGATHEGLARARVLVGGRSLDADVFSLVRSDLAALTVGG